MKYGLSESQLKETIKIISSYPEIEEAILFGSRAINTFKEASDVDIALKGKKISNTLDAHLKVYFEEETNLPYFFDFISYSQIDNKNLKEHIRKYGIVIYRKGWQTVKLGDVVDIIGGFAFKSKHFCNNGDSYVIKIKDIKPPFIDLKEANKVDISHYNKRNLEKFKLKKEDFAIAMTGATIGKIGKLIDDINDNTVYINQRVAKLEPSDKVNKQFIYYNTQNDDFQIFIQNNIDSHSAQENISATSIGNYPISLPPLLEQESISEILSSLDDKIELLHKQNKILEDMAQALFRKWFIEDAKDTWEEKPLDEIANYLNGLACQKYPPKNEIHRLPVLKIKELKDGFTENSDWSTSEVEDKYKVELGDIIFSWSGSLLIKIWNGQKCILNQHLFKVTSKQYPKWFYYFWTKHYMEKFISIAESKATTMGHIKRKDLSESNVLVPTKSELLKMDKLITPQFEKIILNFLLISKLNMLRDTLLPKLITRQVRVS